jgi:hypothetical protein
MEMEMLKERYNKQEIALLQKGIPKTGYVEIRMVDPKRTGSLTLRDYYEEDEFGARKHRPLIDSEGNERVIKYVKSKKVLNLASENDRLEYAHLLDHPIFIKGGQPRMKIVNFEAEADDYVTRKDNEARANEIIAKFSGSKLKDLARVIQITVRPGSSESVLKRALYEYAAQNLVPGTNQSGAERIIQEVDSPDYKTKVSLYKAIESKVVRITNGRYLFGQVSMGTSYEMALSWLLENSDQELELEKQLKNI